MVLIETEEQKANTQQAADPGAFLPRPPRFLLGNTAVDRISMEYAALLITEMLLHRGENPPLTVVGPNAQLVTLAEHDETFAAAMVAADLAVPDGISVVLAARLLGAPIPERVTGGDLMERMCAEAARFGFRIYFLGGLPGAAILAAHNLRRRYPGLQICGTYCPRVGFENDSIARTEILDAINRAAPDLLCVAFGAPKQEVWMQENRGRLRVGVILPVGGAFDTQAGLRHRAPRWIQRSGMEWFFRLLMEPRRLARRYLAGNLQFIGIVLRQWTRGKWDAIRQTAQSRPAIPAGQGD